MKVISARVALSLFIAGLLLSGCTDTIVRIVRPLVEDVIDDKKDGDRGDDPPGGGFGRGGSKDSTGGKP